MIPHVGESEITQRGAPQPDRFCLAHRAGLVPPIDEHALDEPDGAHAVRGSAVDVDRRVRRGLEKKGSWTTRRGRQHFIADQAPTAEEPTLAEQKRIVKRVELLMPDDSRAWVDRAGMAFGYDVSRLHGSGEIALRVEFALSQGDQEDLHRVMQENLAWRGARHPWLEFHPSAGSVFKKIEGVGAGRLVDQCGLKGFRVGNAQISHIHANIVVNLGGATAADVRAVIAHAQRAVSERFDQRLEPEIGFIGEFRDG